MSLRLSLRSLSSPYYTLATPWIALLWFVVQRIPRESLDTLAPFLGHAILFRRKKRTIENMKCVLHHPEWEERHWKELWHRHVNYLGLTIAEMMLNSRMPAATLREIVTIQGDEFLRSSLQRGRGAVVLVNHVGNPGVVPFALALAGYNVSVATNVIPVPYLDRKVNQFLTRLGGTRVKAGGDVILTAEDTLGHNGVFTGAIDYSAAPNHTAWVEFGKVEIQVSLVPAMIGLLYRSAMFSATVTPQSGGRYSVSLQPIDTADQKGELRDQALTITRKAIRSVHEAVHRRPEQWWRWDYLRVRLPLSRTTAP